jgi:hypothetical protein
VTQLLLFLSADHVLNSAAYALEPALLFLFAERGGNIHVGGLFAGYCRIPVVFDEPVAGQHRGPLLKSQELCREFARVAANQIWKEVSAIIGERRRMQWIFHGYRYPTKNRSCANSAASRFTG